MDGKIAPSEHPKQIHPAVMMCEQKVDVYALGTLVSELTQMVRFFLGTMTPGVPDSLSIKEFAYEAGHNGMRPRFFVNDREPGHPEASSSRVGTKTQTRGHRVVRCRQA